MFISLCHVTWAGLLCDPSAVALWSFRVVLVNAYEFICLLSDFWFSFCFILICVQCQLFFFTLWVGSVCMCFNSLTFAWTDQLEPAEMMYDYNFLCSGHKVINFWQILFLCICPWLHLFNKYSLRADASFMLVQWIWNSLCICMYYKQLL